MARAPLPADAVYFGEISLSGAVRPVGHEPARLKEAAKLGFTRAVTPARSAGSETGSLGVTGLDSLAGLVAMIAANAPAKQNQEQNLDT
jgi:DNA repair protein RadA/Sms